MTRKVRVKTRLMIRMRDAKNNNWDLAPSSLNSKKEVASHKCWKISSILLIRLQWNWIPSINLSSSAKLSTRRRTISVKNWCKVSTLWQTSVPGRSKWRRSILIPLVITCLQMLNTWESTPKEKESRSTKTSRRAQPTLITKFSKGLPTREQNSRKRLANRPEKTKTHNLKSKLLSMKPRLRTCWAIWQVSITLFMFKLTFLFYI